MIAGSATPSDARMMWNPSVKAIWLRAASRFEANTDTVVTSGREDAVLSPIDLRRARPVQDLRPTVVREVVPRPGHERVDPIAHTGHQHRVHTDPRRERDDPVQLVAVRPDFCDRGAASDHRHDALVLVVERLALLAFEVSQEVVARPGSRLQGHRPELRERCSAGGGDVRGIADRVYALEPGHCEVAFHIDSSATTLRHAGGSGDLGSFDPATPDHTARTDRAPIRQRHVARTDFG